MQTTPTYDSGLLSTLIERRDYLEALKYIELLNIKKDRSLSREDLAHIYFIQGQCLYGLGDHRRAAVKVKCSIWLSDSLSDNLLYARQKHMLGQIHLEMGRIEESLGEFTEASAFFRRVKDVPRLLAAQEMIALVQFRKGNYSQASEINEALLTKVKALGLSEHIKVVTFNLCRVALLTGDLRRAQGLLDSVAEDHADSLSRIWLESLRGMFAVRMLDDESAKKHLATAMALAREHQYRRDEVVCIEHLALNDYYHGRYTEAVGLCEQILLTPEITPSAVAQTLWLLTEAYVAVGELLQAADTGARAQTAITSVKEWAELGCLHRALGLLADKRNDAQGASEHFGKAIEILSRHGAKYELAVTHLAAGETGCLNKDIRKEHLRRAKLLFVDMGVPKRVAQTDSALARLEPWLPKRIPSDKSSGVPEFVTQNAEMRGILDHAARFAATNMTILITGETGTGKDLLAKRIHSLSERATGPFCNHNMAQLPRELADTELFGYEKNSHSRAERDRAGLIESANGGTICLNEIGELPLELQSKLLLSLEEKTVWRVGARHPVPINVRFIALTNSDLREQVKAGRFREDLFFRLQSGHLHLPPLRDRIDDLPLMLQFFLKRLGFGEYDLAQSAQIVAKVGLDRLDWPGNVRQLENLIGRAVLLAPLPNVAGLICSLTHALEHEPGRASNDRDRDRLLAVLKRNRGNKSAAARELGIPVTTLWNRLKKYGID